MGSQVLATIASVIMKLLVLFCVASFLVISSEGTVSRKNADEAVSEADAEGVYGVWNPEIVSAIGTSLPGLLVNTSATWKGWDKNLSTLILSSSDNSSIPRIAMISWRDL